MKLLAAAGIVLVSALGAAVVLVQAAGAVVAAIEQAAEDLP